MKMYVLQTMCPESSFWIGPNWSKTGKHGNDVIICWHGTIVKFFDNVLFLLSSLVTGPSVMSISSLVLDLWQFSFIRDWPEVRKLELTPLEFCPIYGDWGELGISNLPHMCLMKCYWILQNARVTTFIVSELVKFPTALPIEIRAKNANGCKCRSFYCCLVAIYYFETVLKNFRELRHKDAPVLHISSSILQNYVILLFWNKYSPLVSIFIITDWKFGPI